MRSSLLTILGCGAVLGSIFDGFHTHGGVTAYPHPWVLGMAWWTPLVFGAAALGIALTHVRLDQVLGRPARPLTRWTAAAGLGYFGCFYFLSGFWRVSNGAKLAALVAGFVVLFAILDRTWQGALLALLTALCGCAVEVVLTGLGAFTHLTADRWGIPIWLPGLYLLASLSIGNLGRLLLVLSLCQDWVCTAPTLP